MKTVFLNRTETEANLRAYIVDQRVIIQGLKDRIKELEHSHAMLYVSRKMDGPL